MDVSHTRREDQTVEAFSLSKALRDQAKAKARTKKMSKSGFFRYCLARELGYSEEDATLIALHGALAREIGMAPAQGNQAQQPASQAGAAASSELQQWGMEMVALTGAAAPASSESQTPTARAGQRGAAAPRVARKRSGRPAPEGQKP